jgi:hypothetical protein
MDSTQSVRSTTGSGAAVRVALRPTAEIRQANVSPLPSEPANAESHEKPVGYGLPCAQCKTYYLSSLSACPICKSSERVSPAGPISAYRRAADLQPGGPVRDAERERLRREFKAKLSQVHRQTSPTSHLPCAFEQEDSSAHHPAEVCRTCYERLQSRLELLEAALQMDLREASKVIYDAVWADPSDSSKTYRNAAEALLTELRKRAGMKMVLNSLQALSH